MDAPCRIRPAVLADAPALARRERECFSDPWSEQGFVELLEQPTIVARVMETDAEGIVAYAMVLVVAGSAELLNIAVIPTHRRRGLGQALLDELLAELVRREVEEVFLEVRESNAAAQELYRRNGFHVAGQRRRYYRKPTEDALVLRLDLAARRA
ncbi:MAG: ribosomal protein S18-alanine N-acetyltransferase [Gemmatimonadota bacterium]